MEINVIEEALKLKEEGNEAFKSNNWNKSIQLYTKAINLITKNDSKELAIFLKNRAAAYLKLKNNMEAINDCNKSLEIIPNDPKALFRRCQALKNLERYEEAYRDATQILKNDPNNKTIQPILENLYKIVQEKVKQNSQTINKLESMMKIAFELNNKEEEDEKRLNAMNNLLVLAKENAGAELMIKSTVVQKIKQLLKLEKGNNEIYITGIRIIGELCKHDVNRVKMVLRDVGVSWFLQILDSNCEKQVNAVQYCIQIILNTFSGIDNSNNNNNKSLIIDAKPNKEMYEKNKKSIDTILICLVNSVNNRAISGLARDAIIELIMKNIDHTALNWSEQLVEINGIQRLMECASELEEFNNDESAMNITQSTRTIASVCLSRVYDNMYYDAAKAKYMEKVEEFIKEKLLNPEIESKIRVIVALTSLLKGPMDVGNSIISKDGIIEMILVMANNSENLLQQKVASECIIAAASKIDKAKTIITQGVNILKQLYQSKNDGIKVRALVGLCKLGSSGGNDASLRPFSDGSNIKLTEACLRFLIHPNKDQDLRKWAAEGLSYLTLDAEVKEKLIMEENRNALKALIELGKTGDQSCLFGVITTLVNLCNAYEKQEIIPEMIELAKFAKQHIPEEHELDDFDFIMKRITILANEGVTTALVAMAKTESPNSRELIARVFNALCSQQELRGIVVQQGGVKVLISLALKGTITEKGKRQASQALARIAITINPEVAFPGQRSLEIVRPLINLLHPDCSGLENFEALMGLCNIAQMNENARQCILKNGGLAKIENYMFEDHQYLCRAATQCLTNMTMSSDVVEIYAGNNDKLKYLQGLTMDDEDVDTAMAASGALAILTHSSVKCCEKIFESKNWLDSLHVLLANTVSSLQYRGVCIVKNIIENSKESTEKLMETDVMEILMALTKLSEENQTPIIKVANEALKLAEKWGVIKKAEE